MTTGDTDGRCVTGRAGVDGHGAGELMTSRPLMQGPGRERGEREGERGEESRHSDDPYCTRTIRQTTSTITERAIHYSLRGKVVNSLGVANESKQS